MLEFGPTPVIIEKFRTEKKCKKCKYLAGRYCLIRDAGTARMCPSVCLVLFFFFFFLAFCFLCTSKRVLSVPSGYYLFHKVSLICSVLIRSLTQITIHHTEFSGRIYSGGGKLNLGGNGSMRSGEFTI